MLRNAAESLEDSGLRKRQERNTRVQEESNERTKKKDIERQRSAAVQATNMWCSS